MKSRRLWALVLATGILGGCGTLPHTEVVLPDDESMQELSLPDELKAPPLVESPPIEPVEPIEPVAPVQPAPTAEPPTVPAPSPLPTPGSTPAPVLPAPAPAAPAPQTAPAAATTAPPGKAAGPAPGPPLPPSSVAAPEVPTPPAEPTDDQIVGALVGDLARYAGLTPEDLRKELAAATQALGRQRTDANRVRLAMLYTLTRAPQDDQRALQLLENVARNSPGSPAVKHLAGVLQAQVVERMRAVREEQQKADVAIQKLEALRVLERNLLRDRIRSGGGGGAAGGSGSGGGAGGR